MTNQEIKNSAEKKEIRIKSIKKDSGYIIVWAYSFNTQKSYRTRAEKFVFNSMDELEYWVS